MSRVKQKTPTKDINKTELKCIILRHFEGQREFCKLAGINYGTLRQYLTGKKMPNIDCLVVKAITDLGYNPDGSRIEEVA